MKLANVDPVNSIFLQFEENHATVNKSTMLPIPILIVSVSGYT